MSSSSYIKMVQGSLVVASIAMFCLAITVQAQYNTYDSDSNSDSDGSPILTNAELGKLVRNSAKVQANNRHNQQQQFVAATRNLYNKQQPLQYAPSYNNKRSHGGYGDSSNLNGYGPVMGAASHGRGSNVNNEDDDEAGSSNYGPGFGSNFDNNDDGEGSGANNGESSPINLNQAASGYPGQGSDYNEGAGAGFGFGGGYGPSSDGSEFGPEGFSGEGRRAKSASSLMGSRNYGNSDDDAGAPQYGPNSAVNSHDIDDDSGRAGYAPDNQGDNDNDDE